MKATFFELTRSVGVNGNILAFNRLRQLPVKISASIRLRELSRAIETHVKDYLEEYNELIKKHGTEKDGKWMVEKPGENTAFQADIQRLFGHVVDLQGERFTFTDLFTANGLEEARIAAEDLEFLDWLIDDGVTARTEPEPPAEEEAADAGTKQDEDTDAADGEQEDDQ